MAARKTRRISAAHIDDGAADRYVAALAQHQQLWATSAQLGFPSGSASKALVKHLLAERRILHVGKSKRADAYTLLGSEAAEERLLALASRVVADWSNSDKLVLLPLSAGAKSYVPIPVRVREHIVPALQQSVRRQDAFAVRVKGSNFVALAANLKGLVSAQGPIEQHPAHSKETGSASFDREAVVRAYEQLTLQRRSPNIIVAELQRESGADLYALQRWLLAECSARRAVPLLGEPARATAEQLTAALVVEGRPHLYVRLVQEQHS